jgi:fimbrial chaperone protein
MRRLKATTIIFAAVFLSWDAKAMSVEPLVIDVTTSGMAATQSFKVANDGTVTMPVEVNVFHLEIGPKGELHYEPAEDDFLIYPPQANIPKGGAQIFRVQWIGDPEIKSSRNYRFAVSQVPVQLPQDTSGIQINLSFGVIVSVSPPQAKAAVVVTGATLANGADGKRMATLKVKNPGNKHAYLRNAMISLSGNGWSAKLTPFEVEQKVGLGIVQPGKERRFLIPVEVPAGVSDITASIDYQPDK